MNWKLKHRKSRKTTSPCETHEIPRTSQRLTVPTTLLPIRRAKAPVPLFLRLPLDIRRLVYRYLVPNVDLGPYANIYKLAPKELRKDGEPCYPAILRTNRTIYNEVMREWYGVLNFTAVWNRYSTPTLKFLGKTTRPGEIPPSALRHVANLTLKITLQPGQDHKPKAADDYQALLEACFPPGEALGKLRKLTIDLLVRSPIYWGLKVDRDFFRRALEEEIAHFRQLQIEEFNFRIRLSHAKDHLFEGFEERPRNSNLPSLEERKAVVAAIAEEMLTELGERMTGASLQR